MNSLMAEVLEGHVRAHVFPEASPGSGQADAAEEGCQAAALSPVE